MFPILTTTRFNLRPVVAAVSAFVPSLGAGLTTGHAIFATVLAFLSAILAAYLTSRPGLIQARIQKKKAEDDATMQQISFLHERIRYHSACSVIKTKGKHTFQNELAAVTRHAWNLENILRAKNVEFKEYTYKSSSELNAEEDAALAALSIPAEDDIHRTSGAFDRSAH